VFSLFIHANGVIFGSRLESVSAPIYVYSVIALHLRYIDIH